MQTYLTKRMPITPVQKERIENNRCMLARTIEECEDEEGKEECRTEFDYVCEEAKPKPTYAPPSSGYGIPQAPPISTYAPSTYGGGLKREIPKDDLPQYRYSL